MKADSFLIKHGAVVALTAIAGRVPEWPAYATHRLTEVICALGKPIHAVTLGEVRQAMDVVAEELGLPHDLPQMKTLTNDICRQLAEHVEIDPAQWRAQVVPS